MKGYWVPGVDYPMMPNASKYLIAIYTPSFGPERRV